MKREHRYFVYIVASRTRVLYVGVTNAITRRVLQHRRGQFPGFSRTYRCHRLVYYEQFHYVNTAIAREKEIKGWRREKKVRLIEQINPTWDDLAEGWGAEQSLQLQYSPPER